MITKLINSSVFVVEVSRRGGSDDEVVAITSSIDRAQELARAARDAAGPDIEEIRINASLIDDVYAPSTVLSKTRGRWDDTWSTWRFQPRSDRQTT